MRIELLTYIRTSISYKHLARLTDGRAETDGQKDGKTDGETDGRTWTDIRTNTKYVINAYIYLN